MNKRQVGVAGVIDGASQKVQISRQQPYITRQFTAAHELGHAILHPGTSLHRDMPLDGSHKRDGAPKARIESQADRFAAAFLMPKWPLVKRFESLFGTHRFDLNDDTVFALNLRDLGDIEEAQDPVRALSRHLASTEYYNGVRFTSLAAQFKVSVEAMAIRLEELGLVAER